MAGQEIDPEDQRKIAKLGERITSMRKAMGYTSYEQFAVDKNLPRAQYWRYEKGENAKILSLARLAKAFNITLEELIKDCF